MTTTSSNLAKEGKYVDAVVELVRERNGVSFVEIERLLSPYMDVKGDICLELGQYHNLILWANMSRNFADVIHGVHASKKVAPISTVFLTYIADGRMLSMPIAKRVQSYKDPHWLPVCFNLATPPND